MLARFNVEHFHLNFPLSVAFVASFSYNVEQLTAAGQPMTALNAMATPESLSEALAQCRSHTEGLCANLSPEDCMLQGADFASPPKWHLAHTTWFFDTFVLEPAGIDLGTAPTWNALFNSYYNGIGDPHPRGERGLLSRPSLEEVLNWRHRVNEALFKAIAADGLSAALLSRVELGIQHEMQHQELLLTDLLYSFAHNPVLPTYDSQSVPPGQTSQQLSWHSFDAQLIEVGAGDSGFSFDNERPRFRHFIEAFEIADRLVTNGEFQQFITEGGYQQPEWWLADGWTTVCSEDWQRPLHWLSNDEQYTLQGVIAIDKNSPVMHLSGYEADAFARWAGARLPTEFEWELAANQHAVDDYTQRLYPNGVSPGWFGAAWQWTQSAYAPYPGFVTPAGAVGEYNGKFMSNQWVLRGSSFATPVPQRRRPYRNFFYPQDRWQFAGLRLARTRA